MRRPSSSAALRKLVLRAGDGRPRSESGSRSFPLHRLKRISVLPCARRVSSSGFYDADISLYASRPLHAVTLKELLRFGKPPLTVEKLVESARYVQSELPVRLARRVRALQSLPFIVGTNPHVRSIYQLYHDSFQKVKLFPEVRDERGDEKFTELLAFLVVSHTDIIPRLAKGFKEVSKYMSQRDIGVFLDDMIRARVGIRLIAEQHLALHQETAKHMVGVVNAAVEPAALIRDSGDIVREMCEVHYGSAPELLIDGHQRMTFAYIPVHLEYLMTELLKNAYRATVEQSARTNRFPHPPVQVTISKGDFDVSVRIRDEGGGVTPADLPKIWDYSYTTVSDNAGTGATSDELDSIFTSQSRAAMQRGVGGPIAGLGFGLPLARIYARYFGGSMNLVSLHGYGTDVFLSLPNLDVSRELSALVE